MVRTSVLLPAPLRPMMPNTSPARNRQIDVVQRLDPAPGPREALREIAYFDHEKRKRRKARRVKRTRAAGRRLFVVVVVPSPAILPDALHSV